MSHSHFKEKIPSQHIIEKFVQGVKISEEPHGLEDSGPGIAASDSAKLSSIILGIWLLILQFGSSNESFSFSAIAIIVLVATALAYRCASLAWSRLERLHRLLNEERHEIENDRDQERIELKALYKLKGFEEPLLTEVVSVLMADNDRLLKVMLEEELGLSLASHHHPLELAFGAFLGSIITGFGALAAYTFFPLTYAWIAISISASIAAVWQAHLMSNSKTQAFVWTCSASFVFFFMTGVIFKII